MTNPNGQLMLTIEGECDAHCHSYPDMGPILCLSTPGTDVHVTRSWGAGSTDEEVVFAHALYEAAATYLRQVHAWVGIGATSEPQVEDPVGGDLG